MGNLKSFIDTKLIVNNKLISKRCLFSWFEKNNYINEYNLIIQSTPFLKFPTFVQQLYHIYNDIYYVIKCKCGNPVNFINFKNGYYKSCCNSCAQLHPDTAVKIKTNNLKKYGHEYITQTDNFKNKSKITWMNKYGVDNPTKSKVILNKIQKTNLNKFGVKSLLSDREFIKSKMLEKYGVDNSTKRDIIRKQYSNDRKKVFFENLKMDNRLLDCKILENFEEYKGTGFKHKYNFLCNNCNTEFKSTIRSNRHIKCPICYNTISNIQNEIYDYIISLKIDVILNDRNILNNLELDLYIPSKNLAIEVNGLYWHGEVNGNKHRLYHINKTKLCNEKNIRLIHIFEDEWIYKKEIVKNRLKHILNKNTQKIYARKCEIKEISIKESKPFLEKYHIQGSDNSKIKLGLFYNNNLISVMTFGKLRFSLGNKNSIDSVYEMYRFCSNIQCVGGASKLLNYFIKTHNPKKIISYADNRWSDNNHTIYTKLKFDKVSSGIPNYWYIINGVRKHRFMYRKQNLKNILFSYDDNLTEWENMKNNGYDRIWDCGSSKFELILGDLK
jgi:hypothetical protein